MRFPEFDSSSAANVPVWSDYSTIHEARPRRSNPRTANVAQSRRSNPRSNTRRANAAQSRRSNPRRSDRSPSRMSRPLTGDRLSGLERRSYPNEPGNWFTSGDLMSLSSPPCLPGKVLRPRVHPHHPTCDQGLCCWRHSRLANGVLRFDESGGAAAIASGNESTYDQLSPHSTLHIAMVEKDTEYRTWYDQDSLTKRIQIIGIAVESGRHVFPQMAHFNLLYLASGCRANEDPFATLSVDANPAYAQVWIKEHIAQLAQQLVAQDYDSVYYNPALYPEMVKIILAFKELDTYFKTCWL